MVIQAWNIVLSTVIAVLMVGYGIWLKHIIDQQLKTKNITIESLGAAIKFLEAAITSKDAEISRLKADAAPAIVRAYLEVQNYANHVTEESQRTAQERDALSEQYVLAVKTLTAKTEFAERVVPFEEKLQEVNGLVLASNIMLKHIGSVFRAGPPEVSVGTIQTFFNAFLAAMQETHSEIEVRFKQLDSLSDNLPKLSA